MHHTAFSDVGPIDIKREFQFFQWVHVQLHSLTAEAWMALGSYAGETNVLNIWKYIFIQLDSRQTQYTVQYYKGYYLPESLSLSLS